MLVIDLLLMLLFEFHASWYQIRLHGKITRPTQITLLMHSVTTKRKQTRRWPEQMEQIVDPPLLPRITEIVNRPPCKCRTRPTRLSIMISAGMGIDMEMDMGRQGEISRCYQKPFKWTVLNFHFRPHKNGHAEKEHGSRQAPPSSSYADRSYSLPRQAMQQQSQMAGGYYTADRRQNRSSHPNGNGHSNHHPTSHRHSSSDRSGADTPDFYFMPSQRKYSGLFLFD